MGSSKTVQKSHTDLSRFPGLEKLLGELTGRASSINATDFKENPFLKLADITPDELKAFEGVRGQQGKYDELISSLIGKATRAPTTEDLGAYMNPYQDLVIDATNRRIAEQGDRTQRGISDAAKFLNSFGGSRQAILESMNASETERNIGENTNAGLSSAFDRAMQNYLGQIGIGFDAINQGQASKYKDLASLENIGRTQRENANAQQQLYSEDFLRGQDYPFKQLQALGLASTSFPYDILDKTVTTKQKQSPLNTILGLGTAAAGMFTGNPVLATSGFSNALGGGGGGATGTGGGLGSLWSGATGGLVPGYADGGYVTRSPIGVDSEAIRPSIFGDDSGLTMAPELLSPPDRGGNPVAKLLGMYKDGSRTGNVPAFATGGLLSGMTSGSTGANPFAMLKGSDDEKKPFSFKDIFSNPDALIDIGLRIAASDKNPGAAIAEGVLGYKQSLEKGGEDDLQNLMTQLKMQEILARMNLNEEKFQETMDMNDWRQSEAAEDNARMWAIANATLGQGQARMEQDQAQWQADFNRKIEESKNKPKGKFSYPGLTNTLRTADNILNGVPLKGDIMADDSAIEYTRDSLQDISDAMAANDDDQASVISGKVDALDNLLSQRRRQKKAIKGIDIFGIGGP